MNTESRLITGTPAMAQDHPGSAKRVCFLHVPKTAGVSITTLMGAHFGEGNVFHAESSRHCEMPIGTLLSRHPVVTGHLIVRYLANSILADGFVFTFLRDPVERLLSQYSYYRELEAGHPDRNVNLCQSFDLKEALQQASAHKGFSPWNNLQTWMFSGCAHYRTPDSEMLARSKHNLEQLAFVGVQEELAAGAEALQKAWGVEEVLPLPVLNRTADRLRAASLDEETRRVVEEYSVLDRELHEHATKLWRAGHQPPAVPRLLTDLSGWSEHGSKEIKIASIRMKDDPKGCCQIEHGSRWGLRVCLNSSITQSDLTLGIKIADEAGLTVYGTDGAMQGEWFAVVPGESVIDIDFPPTVLAPGRYFVTCAVHKGRTSEKRCFHWIGNALEIEVSAASGVNFVGLADLGARFQQME